MKSSKLLETLFLLSTLVLGALLIMYYWRVSSVNEMKFVPLYVMICALAYILIQIVRRFLGTTKQWWDWFYYIGLTSMILPIFFGTAENANTFNLVTDFGTLFFVIPVIFDGRLLFLKTSNS